MTLDLTQDEIEEKVEYYEELLDVVEQEIADSLMRSNQLDLERHAESDKMGKLQKRRAKIESKLKKYQETELD